MRRFVCALLAGGIAGALVLGVGGRVLMAALPVLSGAAPRFSWGGSLEVVALGSGYGVVGGAVLGALDRLAQRAGAARGLTAGALLCTLAWLSSPVGRSTAKGAPVPLTVVVMISVVTFAVFGLVADRLLRRCLERRAPAA